MTTYSRFCQRLCTASQVWLKQKIIGFGLCARTRVWTESGEEDFHGVWSLTGGLFNGPPCTGQCKSDWPPTKQNRTKETRWKSGSQNGDLTTGGQGLFQDGKTFSAKLERFVFVTTKSLLQDSKKKKKICQQIFWKSLRPLVQLEILHQKLF